MLATAHHRKWPDLIEGDADQHTYHVRQFAEWIGKMESIREGGGSLLDNCT